VLRAGGRHHQPPGRPYTESEILTSLGDAHAAAGDQDAARVTWRRALSIVSTFEHPDAQRLRERLGLDPVPLGQPR
jgi:hypothetical protein